jgi:4-amino-4-deoxy-L-arabinose transferase-like glycosyltransferase
VCQIAGVVLAFLIVAALKNQSDGLWFQGDAPRHAMNGLFWWDLVNALPSDPVDYAVRYYARYPVIAPVTYPPLFYVLEGMAFAVFGPSPHAARLVVLLFAGMAGLYTMVWARRWIGPLAGWAGAFLAFTPGIVLWSNTVMLNIPATAFGLASLYYFRRWLETARIKLLLLAALLVAADLLTYYPSASVLSVLVVWALFRARDLRFDRRLLWIVAAALTALVPLVGALFLAPVHTLRHVPTIAFLTRMTTWTYYWTMLPGVVGWPALTLGLAGCATGVTIARWRIEAAYVVLWIAALIASLSLLPARDPRYILLAAPAFVIAATIGIEALVRNLPPLRPLWQAAVLAAGLAGGVWSAARTHVPQVSGFRELAEYLQQQAPTDAVLYDGNYDGLFGFYVRVLDPHFDRRLVLADKSLYSYGPTTTFQWRQTSSVATTDDVVKVLRTRLGCRWVAIEVVPRPSSALGSRLLRQAVERSEFEVVRSFPIVGAGERRIDLYRMVGDVDPVATVDLTFPSLSNRAFLQVVPVTR